MSDVSRLKRLKLRLQSARTPDPAITCPDCQHYWGNHPATGCLVCTCPRRYSESQ